MDYGEAMGLFNAAQAVRTEDERPEPIFDVRLVATVKASPLPDMRHIERNFHVHLRASMGTTLAFADVEKVVGPLSEKIVDFRDGWLIVT